MLFSVNACAVVTIGFGRPNVTVVESVEQYMMCVVKDRATIQSAVIIITDVPGSAEQNIGMCHEVCLCREMQFIDCLKYYQSL